VSAGYGTSARTWTEDDLRAEGVRTSLVTACAAVLGIGKTKAWDAYHRGELPFPTIRCGRRVVVPVQPLLELLRLTPDMQMAGSPHPATANPNTGPRQETLNARTVPHHAAG
jgi:hypothetical protein